MPRLAVPRDDGRQLARHTPPGNRGVRDRAQALLGDIIDNVEDAEAPAVGELVDEVSGPARIRPHLDQDRRACPHGIAAGPTLAHG